MDSPPPSAPDIEEAARRKTAELLRSNEALRAEVQALRQACEGLTGLVGSLRLEAQTDRNARRAALNLMEDAVLARRTALAEAAERRRMEDELRANEHKYRALFESMDEGFYLAEIIWGEDQRATDIRCLEENPAAIRIIGEPASGRMMSELPTECNQSWRDLLAHTARSGEAQRRERHLAARDQWLELYCFKLEGIADDQRVAIVFQDITKKKLAENSLRQSEDRLRTLSDAVPQLIWTNDGAGSANYFNQRWYEYTGLSYEQCVGLGWEAAVHPEDAASSKARWQLALAAGKTFDAEFRLRGSHGAYRWFIGRNVPLRDAAGAISGWFGSATDIEDLKQAQAAIRARDERFRVALEGAGMAAWDYHLPNDLVIWNEQHFHILGLPVGEAQQRPNAFFDRLHPEDRDFVQDALRLAIEETGIYRAEFRIIRADDQTVRWMSGFGQTIDWQAGRSIRMTGVMFDVTERREAEAAVHEREEQFRRAVLDAPIPVIMHAEDGQVLQLSRTWTELTGYAPADIPNFEAWLKFSYGEGAVQMSEHMHHLFRGEVRSLDVELDIRTRSGEWRRWALSASAPGTLRDGRRFIVAMALDITERKRAEEALRESQERLRLIVENARDYAIFALDLERRVTSWNIGAERILGYSAEEIIGQPGDVIFTPEDVAAAVPAGEASQAIDTGQASDERWHMRKDGTRFWGSGVMTAMENPQGVAIGLVKIFRDQTEELRAKEALEESRQQLWDALQETERARDEAEAAGRAKDQFLAVLSHELRTPLTPILMSTYAMRLEPSLSQNMREALEMIERNIETEARLVDDLLDVTRISRSKLEFLFEPMDMHRAIERAIEVTRPDLTAKEQRLTVSLEAAEHQLEGDLQRLQQAVWNLLKNASKFTPARGAIHLRTSNRPGCIVVVVSDSGIGIDPAAMTHIFDAFSQESSEITRQFGGLGLGLAIAKATVDAHEGEIHVASQGRNQGATFTVSLPLARGRKNEG